MTRKANQPEFIQHCAIANYLDVVLIPGKSAWTSHEATIGLGFLFIAPADSATTKACKKFYNAFVNGAQLGFVRKGIKKGWGDALIHFMRPGDEYGRTVWLEVKAGYNKMTAEQVDNQRKLEAIGIHKAVVKNIDDVRGVLTKYKIPNKDAWLQNEVER